MNGSKFSECKPIKCLQDLYSWDAEQDWSSSVITLKSRSKFCYDGKDFDCHKKLKKSYKILNSSAPKTILCHDMKGGYLDDRFVNGTIYEYQYIFYHWSIIDIFIYFSHHFITIPPLMWINAAHRHGVPILGTIITEFDDGEKIWKEIFSSDENLDLFISKLIKICDHYNFDGYLINIENQIDIQDLHKLNSFLIKLKNGLKSSNIVIWYDSVSLVDGKLVWQNELNEHNRSAFNICDGIFLNYCWKEQNLIESLQHAGARQYDVYVGIDVFGRGCIGGGGYKTDVAMSAARSFGFSVAIFGFGWTHETQASDENFFNVERKFWSKLLPYLYIHIPNSLPFQTTFNQGIVTHKTLNKKVKNEANEVNLWYDLSFQEYQLSMPSCSSSESEINCVSQCFDEDYSGGSCIMLNTEKTHIKMHKLFWCNFLTSKIRPIKLTIISKWPLAYSPYKLILLVDNDIKKFTMVLEISKDRECLQEIDDYSCPEVTYEKINTSKRIKICDKEWISNEFVLEFDGEIVEINAQVQEPTLIGYFSLE